MKVYAHFWQAKFTLDKKYSAFLTGKLSFMKLDSIMISTIPVQVILHFDRI